MSKYVPNFDIDELGERIKEKEEILFRRILSNCKHPILPAKILVPEFVGLNGAIQINTIDEVICVKRRFRLEVDAIKPCIRYLANHIDNTSLQLVSNAGKQLEVGLPYNLRLDLLLPEFEDDRLEQFYGNKFMNEIITVLHILQLAESIWKLDFSKDLRSQIEIIIQAIFYDAKYEMEGNDDWIYVLKDDIALFALNLDKELGIISHITKKANLTPEFVGEKMNELESLLIIASKTINAILLSDEFQ